MILIIIIADYIPFDYVWPHLLPAVSSACQPLRGSWGGMSRPHLQLLPPSSSSTSAPGDLQVRAWARWLQDRDDDDDDDDDNDDDNDKMDCYGVKLLYCC